MQAAIASVATSAVEIVAPGHLGDTTVAALAARGIAARQVDAPAGELIGWAIAAPPTAKIAVELLGACGRAAAAGRPICVLAPMPRGAGKAAIEATAAIALLRAHGAAIAFDIDAWLEAIVTLARFGLPKGPVAAIVAPSGSWLEAQAVALIAEAEALGTRPPILAAHGKDEPPTDVVLFDAALDAPRSTASRALRIPVIARGELARDRVLALYGVRGALAAVTLLGHAAERIAVGIGPAPATAAAELAIDRERLARQLAKLPAAMRVGDHETKVLLAAFGVPITRQAVATTPSAAVKAARKAGYPVELKPWGHDIPSERDGCPVERAVSSDALVRRGFAQVLAAAGRLPTSAEPGAVIVREQPPPGRDLTASFVKLPSLGWTVVLDVPGAPQLAAAPAPLRAIDAAALAGTLVASRAGDPAPDRTGLANVLRRASHLVVDQDARIARLELSRIVVGGRGARTIVADAWCELR